MHRLRRVDGERGESLLELLVALTILAVAVVAIASGIAVSITVSSSHREQANAGAYLHNYAEQVSGSYTGCGASPPALATQTGFQPPVVSIKYWTNSSKTFGPSTCSTDPGLQQVTISITSSGAGTRISQSLVVVVRKP